MKTWTYTIIILVFGFVLNLGNQKHAYAQSSDWEVPDAKKEVKNPVEANAKSISSGKKLYQTNCKSCHGDPGKNNGLPLKPHPTDMLDPMVQDQSSGELFYRITTGKGAMPSFKAIIQENDRWNIVNYIHSLGGKTAKSTATKSGIELPTDASTIPPADVLAIVATTKAQLELQVLEKSKELLIILKTLEGELMPDVEVQFLAQRYFGQLPLNKEDVYTDQNGMAKISFPSDLPGDAQGIVHIIGKVLDEERYGKVEDTQLISWGTPTNPENIIGKRSLWTVNRYAPIWLIITYFGLVLSIWSFLAYVVFSLFKIKNISTHKAS